MVVSGQGDLTAFRGVGRGNSTNPNQHDLYYHSRTSETSLPDTGDPGKAGKPSCALAAAVGDLLGEAGIFQHSFIGQLCGFCQLFEKVVLVRF